MHSILTNQMDTSYFIKSFSATPRAVVPGYTIGGILYFAIPWGRVLARHPERSTRRLPSQVKVVRRLYSL